MENTIPVVSVTQSQVGLLEQIGVNEEISGIEVHVSGRLRDLQSRSYILKSPPC